MIRDAGSHTPSGRWSVGRVGQVGTNPVLGARGGPRWLAVLLSVLALITVLLAVDRPHDDLAHLSLTGTRGPVCEQVVVAVDQSGSMVTLAGARDAALTEVLAWLPRNLRPDDQLVVLDFAATAVVRMPQARIDRLGPAQQAAPHAVDGRHTLLAPVLSAVADLPRSSCDLDLVLLSDGWLEDLPGTAADGRAALLAAGVHDLYLLVPNRTDADPPADWARAFPQILPIKFDGTDPEQSATAVADAIASSSGQTLTRCASACPQVS